MDTLDRASEISSEFAADRIAAVRRRLPTGHGPTHCDDCGDEIPPARRDAMPGCRMCLACQIEDEAILR